MRPLADKIGNVPRRIALIAIALFLFCALFCLLASHVTTDECCEYIVDQEDRFIDYKDAPVGSSSFWTDFESLPYHIEIGLNLLRPEIGGTLFAYSNNSTNTAPPMNASGISSPMNWAFGFSIGAGYEFFHYDWDFLAKYSFFTTTANSSASNTFNTTLIPALSFGLNGQTVSSGTSKVEFTWNNLDILLDKKFHFRENLLLFTSLGLESSWLAYSQKVSYTGGPFLGAQSVIVQRTSNLWGIGPEAALKTHWLFADCFYFKGFTQGALQYIFQQTSYSETGTSPAYNSLLFSDALQFVTPSLSLGLGLGFAKYFACNSRFVRFELLYEQRTFFRQNQLLDVGPYTSPRFTHSQNDLSLQGFTFKIDFRY